MSRIPEISVNYSKRKINHIMETEIHVPVGSPVIRKFPIFVEENNVTDGAMKLIKQLRPAWDMNHVKTKLFTDGTTNKLVGCYVEASPEDVVLVRVYGNKTELIVDRDNELKSFQVLHANGCAPRLYCTFQNGLCYEFMQGDALGTQDVRDPTILRLISREMAHIHAIHAHNGCIPKPNLWIKMRKYFSLVATEFTDQASNTRIQQEVPSQAVLEQEMVWMKEHLSKLGSPVVLCHNDLLCKNIIHNSKEGHVRFIDYEYSSYNYQAFDIGNHFNEFAGKKRYIGCILVMTCTVHHILICVCSGMSELDYGLYPSREMQLEWLRVYLQAYKESTKKGEEVSDRELETLYVQVNKFALASHFFWGFWALIQAKYSSINFDFLGYAVLRFNQYFKTKPAAMALQIPE
ncbi:ethanolamine kinase 1-like isoform X1 [Oncorhynchus masou masou]|uniref:ethanolamine kinase 1-like isoform X1 n=1 Tax=Oncorhynchus masou masou TaxID=90313 RepID=UPI003183E98F